jgi:S1-C subfamily serine protease
LTKHEALEVSLGPLLRLWTIATIFALATTIFLFFILPAESARAEDADRSLLLYAVAINQGANHRTGAGVYLGDGYVLTASHVVGRALSSVTIAGRDLPAQVSKQDSFEQSDLALLAVNDEQLPTPLRSRRISLCKTPPSPGQDVITAVPEEVVHSQILSPVWLPLSTRKYGTVISDVARTGNSGAGVFDAKEKCLLGIMSRKITESFNSHKLGITGSFDIAKYFVPASVITEFLPKDVLERQP